MLKEENYPHLENIAELLWLSKFTGTQTLVKEEIEDKKNQEPNPTPEIEDDEVEEDEPSIESEMEEEQEDDLEVHTDNQENNTSSSKQKSAKAIQSPKKLALDHYREWERAFKFINLKRLSKSRYELDEEKTVENIASTKVFDLVFKRVEEKSFFLTLVIDQGETMELWKELIKNFEQMLMTMGVFSRISIYYWDTKKEKPILYVDKALKREASEKLVVIDGQRNLVWVMSDCIASSWKSGKAFKSIDRWSTKSFTSILQMFPKEMWMGTMLFKGKHIRLSSNSFNPINKKLQIKPSKRENDALKVPVISFDPYALQAWAKVVVNSKENSISGIELKDLDFEPIKTSPKKEITSEMRMQRFYSQASPTAQKLAFYMSVLPVDFQVTRILQEEKLPKSNQAHVAEVFLGGLIKRTKKDKNVYYDFYPKIREELNANISADDSFEIMADMSNFVSSHLGIGFDFKALLADPNGAFEGDFSLHEESLAYAKLASRVLKRKGGELYTIAKKIDTKVNEIEIESFPKNYAEQVIEKLSNTFIEELVNYEIDDESLTYDGGIASISQVGEPMDIELLKINKIQNNIYSIDVTFYTISYIEVENHSDEMFPSRESEYEVYVDCNLLVKFSENQELLSLNIEKITKVELSEQNYSGSPFSNIRVIGVGGGGGQTVNHMIREGIQGIDLIVANTDKQALDSSLALHKIQLGINTCHGLGTGMKPEIGKESAEESYESIKAMLDGADLVFIVTGLGGGTGTGASPIIARIAKEIGALTVSIVSTPFTFEGKKRKQLAKEGLDVLMKESDSTIVISNEKILLIAEKNLGMEDSFKFVDNIISKVIESISNVILSHGANDINLELNDIRIILKHKGLALMGVGEGKGSSAGYDAAKIALESPLFDNVSVNKALALLVHFYIHPDYPLAKISEAMDIVEAYADKNAHIIFGTTTYEDFALDEVKLTIIAAGIDDYNGFKRVEQLRKNRLRNIIYINDSLRRHHKKAITAITEEVINENKRILLSLVTGSGKSVILLEVIHKLYKSNWYEDRKPRILFLSDRKELVHQLMSVMKELDEVSEISGKNKILNFNENLLFSTIQLMQTEIPLDKNFFDMIIINEIPKNMDKLKYILSNNSKAIQIGFSQNVTNDMKEYFGSMIYEYSYEHAIEDNTVELFRVERIDDVSLLKSKRDSLERIALTILNMMVTDEKVIVVCDSIDESKMITEVINKFNDMTKRNICFNISSQSTNDERHKIQKKLHHAETMPLILAVTKAFIVGIDIRNVRKLVLVTKSISLDKLKNIIYKFTNHSIAKDLVVMDFFNNINRKDFDFHHEQISSLSNTWDFDEDSSVIKKDRETINNLGMYIQLNN
jgi:cell division protein FtsZ